MAISPNYYEKKTHSFNKIGYKIAKYLSPSLNMYQRDIPKLPKIITRTEFVDIVFDLGRIHQHGYDTIVASVQLADHFVSFKGVRRPFIQLNISEKKALKSICKRNPELTKVRGKFSVQKYHDLLLTSPFQEKLEQNKFMYELIPQVYSIELAYVVTVIIAKYNEDDGYRWTDNAIADTNNRYVIKMEWEICMLINFHIKINNFITLIGHIIWHTLTEHQKYSDPWTFRLHSIFFDLSREICMDQNILAKDPQVIIMGCFLLHKMGKLRANRINKERLFHEVMVKISKEYEVDISDFLHAYIKLKKEGTSMSEPRDITSIVTT